MHRKIRRKSCTEQEFGTSAMLITHATEARSD
jgi:hypothetical protein